MADASASLPASHGAASTAAGESEGAARASPAIVDVWSRTEPKYRRRAIGLLVLNFGLFCGLCVFTFWLREARLFDFTLASYIAPARFWNPAAPNLNTYILEPISVLRTPMHAAVLGLLLASIFAVPIVVAILYRFWCAIPFLLAVLLFAHMPWMALTLTFSALLASVPPFRMKFRFGSALVGMLPLLLYLWLATRGTAEALAAASPTQKTLLAAPWVLAILAAAAMIGLVLLIARLVNYRPGAIAPVVAVMFATPVALFHAGVGVDELHYRVLENDHGPRSVRFDPRQDVRAKLRDIARQVVQDETLYQRHVPDFFAALSGQPVSNPRLIWHLLQIEFQADRTTAYRACMQFIADHPHSRYVPNVLYIQARILDTRLEERRIDRAEPRRELYSDFPHVQSQPVWNALLSQHPDSPLAIAAGFRLAQLALRRAAADEALALLDQTLALGERHASRAPPHETALWGLLQGAPAESTLSFEPEAFLREARRLRDLIGGNRDDPRFGNQPLADLSALDPRRAGYSEQLLRLAHRYHGARLYDNILVRWAESHESPQQRAELLERLIEIIPPEQDGLAEAMFRLANLEIQRLASEDQQRRALGVARLNAVVERYPQSCWAADAGRLLEKVRPQAPGNAE